MSEKKRLALLGIGSIFVLEMVALLQGINGTALALSIAGIAGLAGYGVGKVGARVARG